MVRKDIDSKIVTTEVLSTNGIRLKAVKKLTVSVIESMIDLKESHKNTPSSSNIEQSATKQIHK